MFVRQFLLVLQLRVQLESQLTLQFSQAVLAFLLIGIQVDFQILFFFFFFWFFIHKQIEAVEALTLDFFLFKRNFLLNSAFYFFQLARVDLNLCFGLLLLLDFKKWTLLCLIAFFNHCFIVQLLFRLLKLSFWSFHCYLLLLIELFFPN